MLVWRTCQWPPPEAVNTLRRLGLGSELKASYLEVGTFLKSSPTQYKLIRWDASLGRHVSLYEDISYDLVSKRIFWRWQLLIHVDLLRRKLLIGAFDFSCIIRVLILISIKLDCGEFFFSFYFCYFDIVFISYITFSLAKRKNKKLHYIFRINTVLCAMCYLFITFCPWTLSSVSVLWEIIIC